MSVTSLFITTSPFFIISLLSCVLSLTHFISLHFSCRGSRELTLPLLEQRSRAIIMMTIMADDTLEGCKVTDGQICKW